MSNGQQTQNTLYESGIGWGILLLVFAALIWLFWHFFHIEVRDAVRWIRYSEIQVLSWFLSSDYKVYLGDKAYNFHETMEQIPAFPKEKLKYEHLAIINAMAMQPLRIPFTILLGLAALWSIFRGPNTQYRRKLDLQGLIERQAAVFPVISPFIKFNPSTQPPRPPGSPVPADLPLFAEALGPEEWVAYNSIPVPDGKLDEDAAKAAFIDQLGPRWKGSNGLEDYKEVLLAAFCLKASRKRTECDDMLGRLAKCWSAGKGLDLKRDSKLLKQARDVLKNKDLSGKTLAQANRHAFETTAMLRALFFARSEGGVLAPAQFVWLRAHDRRLWYPLNNMGRQSFHMEALGAMAHYRAEKQTQRPIPVPKVDGAVQTLREYMGSARVRPIPQLDYSKSSKRGIKKAI